MDSSALLCNICPKRPNFSDVSHLLTHVSSKAHLSNYFKLQVRSHQDPPAGDLLREYDRWYKANNLAKLLSDRMASKEARKKKSQSKSSKCFTPYLPKRVGEHKTITLAACPSPHHSLPNFLDPRLSDSYLNAGPIPGNGDTFPSGDMIPILPTALGTETHFHSDYPRPSTPTKGPLPRYWKQEPQSGPENEPDVHVQTPTRHRGPDNTWDTTPRLLRSRLSYDPFVDYDEPLEYLGITETDKERADEIARLKGVLWPGMDIFDSATEQMRRKRNQKKDASILRMMEKTSMCVEPTELIFSPTGILRKQRVISGNVEDSSPLKGETPIPKRRAVRPKRGLLSQADPNIPRGQDRKRPKKSAGCGLHLRQEEPPRLGLHIPQSPTTSLPVLHRNGYYSPTRGESDELELSVRAFQRKPRNGFEVFHDDEGKYRIGFKDQFADSGLPYVPAPSSYQGFARREPMAYGSLQPSTSGSCVSNVAGQAYTSANKENIEPFLTSQGRVDPLVGWSSPFMKRRYPSDIAYPPQYFVSEAHRAGFTPFEDHGMLTGFSCNPLATSLSKLPGGENNLYGADTDTATDYKSRSEGSPDSPNATISDIERDDFERLYLDGSSY